MRRRRRCSRRPDSSVNFLYCNRYRRVRQLIGPEGSGFAIAWAIGERIVAFDPGNPCVPDPNRPPRPNSNGVSILFKQSALRSRSPDDPQADDRTPYFWRPARRLLPGGAISWLKQA